MPEGSMPRHLGIIMDGNRRWAQKSGVPVFEGHRRGADKIEEVSQWCLERGIKFLTLYAFSTENWNRSSKEVDFLMSLGKWFFSRKIKKIRKEGIKIRVIGEKERLSPEIQNIIQEAESLTRDNEKLVLSLAISYGGRAEFIEAVKRIIGEGVKPEDVNEELISQHLWTAGLPDPDLIIRTSGEQRTSGFLSWQSVYSEWYFCPEYWPNFSKEDLDKALADYASRQKRYGR